VNYFSHGIRFVDRPYFLAGTAAPDWLSVVDRRVRLRSRSVAPFADGQQTPHAEFAAGVLQHLADDDWFHRTPAFAIASAELANLFQKALPADAGHRPAFLGHILTEILLDAELIERHPDRLARYYAAIREIDPLVVEQAVNQMVRQTTDQLHVMIVLFEQERFLEDYSDTSRLLLRLNQVMRRVGLQPLPGDFESALGTARGIVARHFTGLLSGWDRFPGGTDLA
jgi:hypothetical protein